MPDADRPSAGRWSGQSSFANALAVASLHGGFAFVLLLGGITLWTSNAGQLAEVGVTICGLGAVACWLLYYLVDLVASGGSAQAPPDLEMTGPYGICLAAGLGTVGILALGVLLRWDLAGNAAAVLLIVASIAEIATARRPMRTPGLSGA